LERCSISAARFCTASARPRAAAHVADGADQAAPARPAARRARGLLQEIGGALEAALRVERLLGDLAATRSKRSSSSSSFAAASMSCDSCWARLDRGRHRGNESIRPQVDSWPKPTWLRIRFADRSRFSLRTATNPRRLAGVWLVAGELVELLFQLGETAPSAATSFCSEANGEMPSTIWRTRSSIFFAILDPLLDDSIQSRRAPLLL